MHPKTFMTKIRLTILQCLNHAEMYRTDREHYTHQCYEAGNQQLFAPFELHCIYFNGFLVNLAWLKLVMVVWFEA